MWIIQEFILPEKMFILWGSEGLWWGDLLFWLNTTVYTGELFGLPGFRKVKHLCLHKYRQPRYMKGILPTTSLNDLVAAFGYGLCADPRDRVFSLLGLVNDGTKVGLEADYTLSSTQVYYRVLCHTRHAPSLMSSSTWEEFRGLLRAALEVEMDGEYLLFDLIYQIAEPDRPQHRTTVSFYPEARATL